MSDHIYVGSGRIRIPRETFDRYLSGVNSVALARSEGGVHLLPLRGPVAGGRLVKQRNLRGDRVIEAAEFLAQFDIGDFSAERRLAVHWDAAAAALAIDGL